MYPRRLAAILLFCSIISGTAGAAPVPGYAPENGDYRFCQTLRGALIGGAGAFIGTGLIGTYRNREVFNRADGTYFDLEPVAVAATTAGFFGAALGALFGYATGVEQSAAFAADSGFTPHYALWGPRILMIFSTNPRFHICRRFTDAPAYLPDRIRAGFMYRPRHGYPPAWYGSSDQNAEDLGYYAMEFDWDLQAVWRLGRLKKMEPYAGFSSGYARSRHFNLDDHTYKDLRSPYLRLLAGIELNASDYLFLEIEGMHEVFGTQRLLDAYGYHQAWNTSMYLYIGSYFF